MASIDELASAIGAARDRIDQIGAGLSRSHSLASELRDEFASLGADDKTAVVDAVKRELEAARHRSSRLGDQAERMQVRAEALKADDRGRPGTVTTALPDGAGGPRAASRASRGRPVGVPATWPARPARTGKGRVWQRPGAEKDADSVRVMDPTERYPNGYAKFYNEHNQPIGRNGKPGSRAETHIPVRDDGTFDLPQGWHHDAD